MPYPPSEGDMCPKRDQLCLNPGSERERGWFASTSNQSEIRSAVRAGSRRASGYPNQAPNKNRPKSLK